MATGDRGFFSAKNEREAEALGVKKVALPAQGRLSARRAEQQRQRWFRRGLRWRAGIEATMSTLKHPFSMARATYKGDRGFQRYVGWCVITKNLFSILLAINSVGGTMTSSRLRGSSSTTQAAGRDRTSGRDRCLWNALGNLPHLRTSGLPLSGRWTQAWSASECELPRGEGQDHWLLCSQGSGGGYTRRGGRLATNPAIFARTGGVE